MRRFALYLTVAFAALSLSVHAQNLTSVTVDLSAGTTTALPFDEPFFITGSVSPQVQRLEFSYEEVACGNAPGPSPASPCPAPPLPGNVQHWVRRTEANTFQFTVGKLEPNKCYRFNFKQFLQPAVEADRKVLQSQLATLLRAEIQTGAVKGFISAEDRANLEKALQMASDRFVDTKFHACGPAIKLTVPDVDPLIDKELTALFTNTRAEASSKKNIEQGSRGVARELCIGRCLPVGPPPVDWTTLGAALRATLADDRRLSTQSRQVWRAPLDPANGAQATNMMQFAQLIADDPAPTLTRLLSSSRVDAGQEVDNNSLPSPGTARLIADFLSAVRTLALANGRPFLPAATGDRLAALIPTLRSFANNLPNPVVDDGATDAAVDAVAGLICSGNCPLQNDDWAAFRKTLSTLIADASTLSAGSKAAWDAPLNPARDEHMTTKLADVARLFINTTNRPALMTSLLAGKAKIVGTVVQPSVTPDPGSIELLADFIEVISSTTFTDKNGARIVTKTFADRAPTIITGLRQLASHHREGAVATAAIAASSFPDILANHLLDQSFGLTTSPTVITEQKNPYISLDMGLAYGFRAEKAFPYAGVNFYRVPVNKRAPLNQFSGRERFWRSASVILGLTTSAFEDDRTKKFLSAGSPMLGVGYRFNQFVKANAGVMAFKHVNANPLIGKQSDEYAPWISVSIDVDVKTLLGNVGNLFGGS